MARPAKAVSTMSKHLTEEEKQKRIIAEQIMQGNSDRLVAPEHLSYSQKDNFDFIVQSLNESKLLGNIDIFILTQTAIVIDRLTEIEKKINDCPELLCDAKFMATQDRYSKQFARCCNELSLSPQSRAKLSIQITNPNDKKKTIMDMLNDDEE